jgi:hypothetical protein
VTSEARVKFPNERTMTRFAAMVQRREPLVNDVMGFMDGLTIPCACSSEQLSLVTNGCASVILMDPTSASASV